MTAKMSFGNYDFGSKGQPVPIFTYSRSTNKLQGTNFGLSQPITLTFEGNLVITGEYDLGSGNFETTMGSIRDLSESFKDGSYERLLISGCSNVQVDTSGLVTDLNINPRSESDPYVHTASYTITMEVPSLSGLEFDNQPSGITSITEDWNVEFNNEDQGGQFTGIGTTIDLDQLFVVSHNVSVSAREIPGGNDGVVVAEEYIRNELAADTPTGAQNGIFSFNLSGYYNHIRTFSKNSFDGSVTMSETWIVGNNSGASESIEVNVEDSEETMLRRVSLQGSIQGYSTISYSNGIPNVSKSKIDSAYDYFNVVSGYAYNRANAFIDESLNPNPLSNSFGYNTKAGVINYSYTYDTRALNCVSDAKFENITFNQTLPTDVFASLTIPGRSLGPLLQNIATTNQRVIGMSIEAVLPTGHFGDYCAGNISRPTGYDDIVSNFVTNTVGAYSTYFKNDDNETYNPKTGRFSKSISYVVGNCS